VRAVENVEVYGDALKEAFSKTGEPLGWWFMGQLSGAREAFDFYQKSAEAGCSWGQVAYAKHADSGMFVEQDGKAYVGVAGNSGESKQSPGDGSTGRLVSR
jgi:hypothetical protein